MKQSLSVISDVWYIKGSFQEQCIFHQLKVVYKRLIHFSVHNLSRITTVYP